MNGLFRRRLLPLWAALALSIIPNLALAQQTLCLKNGSCQLVKTYQVQGNRVRYYSLERSEWEEVPLSLVDFAAGRRADAAKQQERRKVLDQAEQTQKTAYRLPADTGYLVAQGVRLPVQEGLYEYSGARVVTMMQSQASVQTDRRRALLTMAVPGPMIKNHPVVVLPGRDAAVRLLTRQPVFYAHFAGGAGANLRLLRVKQRKADRSLEGAASWIEGKGVDSEGALPLERKQVAPGIFRIQPARALAPGEYAWAEVDGGKLNLDVWDFGIDAPKSSK